MPHVRSGPDARARGQGRLPELMARAAEPLPELDDPAFGRQFEQFGDARVVLLGEASHGTAEFYQARAAITRWLIEHRGFTIVALEADWPDARSFDAHVRGRPPPFGADRAFDRFPTWMWRNAEFSAFLGWLRGHNATRPAADQAGVYGLDLYSLQASMRAVIDYLDREDPEAAKVARQRYGCLTPWADEPAVYGRMAITAGYARCEELVTLMLTDLLKRHLEDNAGDEALLDATQNARLVRDAEAYYRAMYYGGAESWNLRDTHMFETLDALMAAKGPDVRAVVWAHNSHIGDARATEMGQVRNELNLGQLCRGKWGRSAALIGLGTHGGTVACASDWDGPMEVKTINPALPGSHESLAHATGIPRYLLDLRPGKHEELREQLAEPRLERFIGVIYRPQTERWSHYAEARLPRQFDAYTWFDETHALTPLPARTRPEHQAGDEETWPFGL
jgi:erythromycin esterase-like protein